mgnify:CR=1 FL=1
MSKPPRMRSLKDKIYEAINEEGVSGEATPSVKTEKPFKKRGRKLKVDKDNE